MELMADSINHVCPSCMSSSLTEEIKSARCMQCNRIYCIHFASSIDPTQCVECLSDLSLTKETVIKTYEHYDEATDVVTSYRRKATRVKLDGLNWLFSQRKIVSLSDDDLELSIEYHRQLLTGMIDERETRRMNKAHRFAGLPMPKSSDSATSTTTKVTKNIKSNKQAATADSLLQSALSSGMTPKQILVMLSGFTVKAGS